MNNKLNIYEVFKNIDKFRVLENLVIKDVIKNKEELFNLVKNISKINTIKRLNLFYFGKLSFADKTIISHYFQNKLFINVNKKEEKEEKKNGLKIFQTEKEYKHKNNSLFYLENVDSDFDYKIYSII